MQTPSDLCLRYWRTSIPARNFIPALISMRNAPLIARAHDRTLTTDDCQTASQPSTAIRFGALLTGPVGFIPPPIPFPLARCANYHHLMCAHTFAGHHAQPSATATARDIVDLHALKIPF